MDIMDYLSLLSFNSVTVAIVVVLLILLVSRSLQCPANLPPGPTGYPIIGCMPLLKNRNILDVFRELRGKYGDVFCLKIGPRYTVVINGTEALKEAFVKHADDFSDRPAGYITEVILKNKGFGGSSGERWKRTRTFSLSTLRDFGFGRRSLESRLQEEVTAYLDAIEKLNGKPHDLKDLTVQAISNNMCSITFGNRYEYSDEKFKSLISLFAENFQLVSTSGAVMNYPWVRYLPGDVFKIKQIIKNFDKLKAFVTEHIEDHRSSLDENSPRDFIDAFLVEQKKHGVEDPVFDDMNLTVVVMALFSAGTDTTATMIRWALLYLIHNKPIQDKLRQEIMTVVGTSRLPLLADKPDMPYYEAFITEVLRMGDITPLSVPHGAKKDIHFRGMVIPNGSMIIPLLDSVMTDSEMFENPDKFEPERFLGKDGQLNGKEKNVIAFSLGRRVCLGESLARMELFLFMTSLIQRFEILPDSPDKLPSFDSTFGLVRASKDYSCRAVRLS